jgi:hypothetical protein
MPPIKNLKQKTNGMKRIQINYKKILGVSFILLVLVYVGFVIYNLASFRTSDQIVNSNRVKFQENKDIEKTVFVLLDNNNDISAVDVYFINKQMSVRQEIEIPDWVYTTEYSGSYDTKISVKNLSYVGKNVNASKSSEYLIWQLQNIVATSFEHYVIIDSKGMEILGSLSEDKNNDLDLVIHNINLIYLITNSSKFKDLNGHILSNANSIQLYSILNQINTSKEAVSKIDLGEEWALSDTVLANGKTVRIFNSDAIDLKLSQSIELFKPVDVSQEQVKVEVYNGSGIAKAALRYSRTIQNLGARVVRTGNSPTDIDKTVVYVSNKQRYQKSLALVQQTFVDNPEIIEGRPSFMTTGDIVVVLGKDIQKEIDWR